MMFPVREGGRDVSGEGAQDSEPDDGKHDLKQSRMIHLEGKFSSGQTCWCAHRILKFVLKAYNRPLWYFPGGA